ncbi:6-phospho-3-hexuloisomerase [Streptomyces sp. NPDC055607]
MVDQSKHPSAPSKVVIGTDGPFGTARRIIAREVDALLSTTDESSAQALVDAVYAANRVFTVGAGRSKLVVDAFAMRLMHLGLDVHVVSDVTTPAVEEGDLLIACSGSGETPTVLAVAEAASRAGARLAVVTAAVDSRLANRADVVVLLREYSQDRIPEASTQFIGTLFEQGAFVFFDCLVMVIETTRGVDPDGMFARHTNLE